MSNENLKQRTKLFALNVLKFVEKPPRDRSSDILGRQLLRSGTSVGANYRSACRAKSPADFISKLGIVEEEADESGFWLELLLESGKARAGEINPLMQEAGELVAIMIASINTTRKTMTRGTATRSVTPHSALRTPH
jgi:four helix bundle protein